MKKNLIFIGFLLACMAGCGPKENENIIPDMPYRLVELKKKDGNSYMSTFFFEKTDQVVITFYKDKKGTMETEDGSFIYGFTWMYDENNVMIKFNILSPYNTEIQNALTSFNSANYAVLRNYGQRNGPNEGIRIDNGVSQFHFAKIPN